MSNPDASNASPGGHSFMKPSAGVKISSSARGILRSSSLGHSSLSLQQVIHRIVGGGGGHQQPSEHLNSAEMSATSRPNRSRSFSMSDMTKSASTENPKSPIVKSPRVTINLDKLPSKSPEQVAPNSKAKREGTPESDAGYVTSANSTSPDYSLAELVRAMKLGGNNSAPLTQNQDGSSVANNFKSRTKLPSISELDPAVSHAVKSCGNVYQQAQSYHYQHPSPNLLDTLFANTP